MGKQQDPKFIARQEGNLSFKKPGYENCNCENDRKKKGDQSWWFKVHVQRLPLVLAPRCHRKSLYVLVNPAGGLSRASL